MKTRAAGVGLLILTALLYGLPAPQVRVQFADGVTPEARARLEQRLRLREHSHDDATSYLYDLIDPSAATIRALVEAPEVRDTDGVIRSVFELRAPQRYGERRTGLAWRWGLEGWVPVVAVLAVGLLLGGVPRAFRQKAAQAVVRSTRSVLARERTWGVAGVPAMDARAFGLFRVAFAALLIIFLVMSWKTGLPMERQRTLAFPVMDWIRPWAASRDAVAGLQAVLLAVLLIFAAGIWSRVMFALAVAGFELWFFVFALGTGAHPLGLLPLALPVMLLVPWHEGVGMGGRVSARAPSSRVPYGFAPWVLGLSLGIAFLAAGYSKGIPWALNGTVRYHFMTDGEVALVPWGLWIAAHPTLSVFASTVVVIGEHAAILGMFWRPRWRALMGLVVVGLIAGFSVFHNAIWPAWWVLVLGFLPWEWLNGRPTAGGPAPALSWRLPLVAVIAVFLLLAQQLVVSWGRIEAGPYFSAYDMYSTTFASPEEFERINGAPRLYVLASVPSGDLDISACVDVDPDAVQRLRDAAIAGAPPVPAARARVVSCAVSAKATAVRVLADQRTYDWTHGRTGYRFRGRLVAQWPVP